MLQQDRSDWADVQMLSARGATIRQKAYCDMENLYCDTPSIFISVYYWP